MNAQELVEQDMLSQERVAIQNINRIAQLEAAVRQAKQAVASANGIGDVDLHIAALRDQVKQWLALNGRDSLTDGETGIEVALQERKGAPVYDVPTLLRTTEGRAALLAAGEQVGMVQIVHKQVESARRTGAAWLDRIAAVEMPSAGTTALVFRERGRWK